MQPTTTAASVLYNALLPFVEYICVVLVVFAALFQTRVFHHLRAIGPRRQLAYQVLLVFFFGVLSLYGTHSGLRIFGRDANFRDFSPLIGGILAGPLVGVGAAAIGVLPLFFIGGQTRLASALAALVAGAAGGVMFRYKKDVFISPATAFVFCLLLEAFNILMTVLLSAFVFGDFAAVFPSLGQVILPILVVNTFGLTVFAVMVRNFKRLSDRSSAQENVTNQLSVFRGIQERIIPNLETCPPDSRDAHCYDWLQSYMELERFGVGEVLFRKDEVAEKMYLVKSGRLRVAELDVLIDEGKLIGETGLFSPFHRRTATIVCETDVEIYSLSQKKILEIIAEKPSFLMDIMRLTIMRSMGNLAETIAAKEKIESELKVAKEIQVSMLPRRFPAFPDRGEFDVFAMMNPAKEVGGDLYDFFAVDENRYCFIVGDVSGKGVPAALYMAITKTLLKSEALKGHDPGTVLGNVHRIIYPDNAELMFITVFCAILDIRTGELQYANAGHNPPLLCRGGGDFEFVSMKPNSVLGAIDPASFENERMTIEPGDTFFMYTDGVNEAMNVAHEQYDYPRLKAALSRMRESDPRGIVEFVRGELEVYERGEEQSDDITMLSFKYLSRKPS
jgi:serine phosphatase RsbU (regulator of sigma subunit)